MFSDAGFVKTTSAGQYFTTISDMELKKLGALDAIGNTHYLETIPKPFRKDGFEEVRELVWSSFGRCSVSSLHLNRYGIEIKIDFLHDGTTCWVVISQGTNKYVTEMLQLRIQLFIIDDHRSCGKLSRLG